MINLDTVTTILVAVVPAVTTIITLLGVVIKIISLAKSIKVDTANQLAEKTTKMSKSFEDIATLKTKISSIESYLVKEKEKKK